MRHLRSPHQSEGEISGRGGHPPRSIALSGALISVYARAPTDARPRYCATPPAGVDLRAAIESTHARNAQIDRSYLPCQLI